MNTALWIVQILLGVIMSFIGLMKTFSPINKLEKFTWTTRYTPSYIRFVGISELLIGCGLILPQWTGILPILTFYAAIALCIIMVLAIKEHLKYGENHEIWKNVIFILLAAFVAIGRFQTFTT